MAPEEVRVELGRCDIGMAEKLLYDAEICPSIEEVRCKRVAQRVGVDLASKACRHGSGPNRRPGRLPPKPHATARQEERLRLWGRPAGTARCLLMNLTPVTTVGLDRIQGWLADGDDALPPALAKEPHGSVIQVHRI